mgnify:CR=1 FL=1
MGRCKDQLRVGISQRRSETRREMARRSVRVSVRVSDACADCADAAAAWRLGGALRVPSANGSFVSSASFNARRGSFRARGPVWGRCEALWLRVSSGARFGAPRTRSACTGTEPMPTRTIALKSLSIPRAKTGSDRLSPLTSLGRVNFLPTPRKPTAITSVHPTGRKPRPQGPMRIQV